MPGCDYKQEVTSFLKAFMERSRAKAGTCARTSQGDTVVDLSDYVAYSQRGIGVGHTGRPLFRARLDPCNVNSFEWRGGARLCASHLLTGFGVMWGAHTSPPRRGDSAVNASLRVSGRRGLESGSLGQRLQDPLEHGFTTWMRRKIIQVVDAHVLIYSRCMFCFYLLYVEAKYIDFLIY